MSRIARPTSYTPRSQPSSGTCVVTTSVPESTIRRWRGDSRRSRDAPMPNVSDDVVIALDRSKMLDSSPGVGLTRTRAR